jgi:hypothetical protein
VIFKHTGNGHSNQLTSIELLPGTVEYFNELEKLGHYIVLMTSRKECTREELEYSLRDAGLFWDQLIMGVAIGARYLINDMKPNGDLTAFASNLIRNEGLNNEGIPRYS